MGIQPIIAAPIQKISASSLDHKAPGTASIKKVETPVVKKEEIQQKSALPKVETKLNSTQIAPIEIKNLS